MADEGLDGAHREAVAALLWQLADDDLLAAHRASEWLGLAPHIEEDVAFSSIAQDEMGHAATYFGLLEDLGYGRRDDLAHLRPPAERRNSVLLELPNGSGDYLQDPHFDWSFTVARHFLYDTFESLRLARLTGSSYQPLAEAADKILREERYHRMHQETWVRRMAAHNAATRERLQRGLSAATAAAGDLFAVDSYVPAWTEFGIFPGSDEIAAAWQESVSSVLRAYALFAPPVGLQENGRVGQHTPHLAAALDNLAAVYRLDPQTAW